MFASSNIVSSLALLAASASLVRGMGQSISQCTITQGYTLQSVEISVHNPATSTTETLKVTPKSGQVAYATINAPYGHDVTVNYVYDQSTLSTPHNGTDPAYSDTVTWVGFMHKNYNTGACLDVSSLSQYLPNGGLTYADEQREDPYTEGMEVAHADNGSLSTAANGFQLAFHWFNSTLYPGTCGPNTTHGTVPVTQCIVPDVLLGVEQ